MTEQYKPKAVRDYEAHQAQEALEQKARNRDSAWNAEIKRLATIGAESLQRKQAADAVALAEKTETDFRQGVCDAFITSGGNVADFESEWPALRADIVRTRTLQGFAAQRTASDVAQDTLNKLYGRKGD